MMQSMTHHGLSHSLHQGVLVLDADGAPAIVHRIGSSIVQLAYPTGELDIVRVHEVTVAPARIREDFTPSPVLQAIRRFAMPNSLSGYGSHQAFVKGLHNIGNMSYFPANRVSSIKLLLGSDRPIRHEDVLDLLIETPDSDNCQWVPAVMPRHWHTILRIDGPREALQAVLDGIASCEPLSLVPNPPTAPSMIRESVLIFTQLEQIIDGIHDCLMTTQRLSAQHIVLLSDALHCLSLADRVAEQLSVKLFRTVDMIQVNYLQGKYDNLKPSFLHCYLALLGIMQNLRFLSHSQIRAILNWIQELFIPNDSGECAAAPIVARVTALDALAGASSGSLNALLSLGMQPMERPSVPTHTPSPKGPPPATPGAKQAPSVCISCETPITQTLTTPSSPMKRSITQAENNCFNNDIPEGASDCSADAAPGGVAAKKCRRGS
jgi:hypothetical protein